MAKPHTTFETEDELFEARDHFWRLRGFLALGWACFLVFLFVFPFSLIRIGGVFGLLASLIVITTVFFVLINATVRNELRGYGLNEEVRKLKNEERLLEGKTIPVHYVVGDDGEVIAHPEPEDDDTTHNINSQNGAAHKSQMR